MENPLDLKIAQRIRRSYPYIKDELRVRVAIESDRDARNLTPDDKGRVTQLILDDITHRFPLPKRGATYSQDEWHRIRVYWVRQCPAYAAVSSRISEWESQLEKEIGARFDACYRGWQAKHPRKNLYSAEAAFGCELGAVARKNRTPERLRAMMPLYQRWLGNVVDALNLLATAELYDPTRDPDEVVNQLRDTHAQYFAEPILKHIFKVPLGSMGNGRITIYDILSGMATAKEVLDNQRQKEEAYQASTRRWVSDMSSKLVQAGEAMRQWYEVGDVPHLPTLSRRIKEACPGCRIERSVISGRHTMRFVVRDVGSVSGPYGHLDDVPALMLATLLLCEKSLKDTGGVASQDALWRVINDASAQSVRLLGSEGGNDVSELSAASRAGA